MSSEKKNAVIVAVLAGVIFLASVGAIFYMRYTARRGRVALVYQDNTLIRTIELTPAEPYTITIEGENGAYNVLEIRDGSVGIVEASCPDGLCQRMGFISDSLMPITCLPNHLIVEVAKDGEGTSGDIDGIVY